MHAAEFPLLTVGQFGLLAAQFSFGTGDGHALAGAHADEIGLELGEGCEDVEEHLAHGIVRVVERPSEGQFHAALLKLIGDGADIRNGPGEAVEFGHDQSVALAQGSEGLALGGQILPVGGAARVSDEGCGHGGSVRIRTRLRNCFRTIHMRCSWCRSDGARGNGLGRTLGVPLTDSAAPAGVNG